MRATVVVVIALLAVLPSRASASIAAAAQIDGPGADVLDVGGVAMAPDGTGGLVYRKRVEGRSHVFAAQFVDGAWRPAQRVDNGQRFDSSWPAIGAGDDGRLVVTWVQEFGLQSDRMFSAALDPGARRFQAPTPVDLNVGESTATWPSLSMNQSGGAYLTYLVMQQPTGAEPPGYASGELRLARYDGTLWSPLGFPVNRNPAVPLPQPGPDSRPRVVMDAAGNGILAWREPDDNFIDRIWARRVFGAQLGIPLLVSPGEWDHAPLFGPADAFSLDSAGFGSGAIALRQQPGQGGRLAGTRVLLATIPESSDEKARAFGAPRIVDGAGAGGPSVAPGPPSVAVTPTGSTATAFGFGQRSLLVTADDRSIDRPDRLDDGRTAVPGDAQVDLGPSGAAVAAWKVRRGALGGIGVTERRADGVPVSQVLSARGGGNPTGLVLGGSGLGDALVAWSQQAGGATSIAASVVDAPPDSFVVQTPLDWVRRAPVRLDWDPPAHAIGGVRYAVTVDDDTVAEGLTRTSYNLRRRALDDGVSVVQIVAEDSGGQETTSAPADLKVDTRAPRLSVRRFRNRLVEVRVVDGRRGRVSGVDAKAVRVAFGDGGRGRGRSKLAHRYARGGTFTVVARVRDKAGNRATVRRKVRL